MGTGDDMRERDLENTDAGNDDATSRIKVLAARAILEEATEGTTVRHRQPPRVSWVRRLLNWFTGG